jgi:pimeloyl-ACP methyl ester carboxylesterase
MRRTSIAIFLAIGLSQLSLGLPRGRIHAAQASRDATALEALEATMTLVRNRNAKDYAITSPGGIDEARFVRLGGVEQWITIRGEDRRNPVLLFLHGGPGDAINPWAYAGFRSWLTAFTVVQWDQRGAGRTFGRNGPSQATTITIERMTQDGIELAELLRSSLHKERILLVGHSWGSLLGVFMVKERPDLFAAFVGTGQVSAPSSNSSVAYAALVKKAEALGEQRALQELKDVGAPPYANGRGYAVQRKWSNLFEGADLFIASMFGLALGAPGYTSKDVTDWIDGQSLSAGQLVPRTSTLPKEAIGGRFEVPVFVIQGAEDFTTPSSLAKDFVNTIRAPRKEFVAIEGGHFAVFIKSEAFLKVLVARVRPLVR